MRNPAKSRPLIPGTHIKNQVGGVTLLAALLALALGGCGDDGAPSLDAGADASMPTDASTRTDASRVDSDVPADDGGTTDPGWRSEPALPVNLQEIAAAELDGLIYVAGGFEGFTAVATVRIYDPATSTWSTAPSLPFPRHHLMLVAVAVTGDLYAIGGMADIAFEALDTAFVLHVRDGADAWEPIASLPENRAAGAGGAVNGRIVVAGGQERGGLLSTDALIYDPAAGSWSRGAPIPTPREHVGGFAHGGELWVVGGRDFDLDAVTDAVEVYDVEADEWRAGPALGMARGGIAAAALDGIGYVSGGERTSGVLDSMEALDLETGAAWSEVGPMPTPHHGHAMAAAGGRVYVIGGADTPAFGAVNAVESYAP